MDTVNHSPSGATFLKANRKLTSWFAVFVISTGVIVACSLIRLASSQFGTTFELVALGALVGGYGVCIFAMHGGRRTTVLGLFNMANALFVGFPGFVLLGSPVLEVPPEYLADAMYGSVLSLAAINVIGWRLLPRSRTPNVSDSNLSVQRTAIVLAGAALYFGASLAKASGLIPPISYLGEGFAFVGILGIAVGLVSAPRYRLVSFATIAIVLLFLAYMFYNHSGTGRLRIVALACSLLLLISLRFPLYRFKTWAIIGSPVAIWALASIRLAYQESLATGSSAGRSGLESMLSPIATLAHLLAAIDSGWESAGGASYLTIFAAPLPNSVHPDWLPPALGYDLVRLVAPDRFGSGFSLAVTSFGEAVWNFGVVGFVIVVPLAVLLIAFLDWVLVRCSGYVDGGSVYYPVAMVAALMMAGTIGDFAWNGVHTFGTRIGTRVPAVAVLLLIVAFFAVLLRSLPAPPQRDQVGRISTYG